MVWSYEDLAYESRPKESSRWGNKETQSSCRAWVKVFTPPHSDYSAKQTDSVKISLPLLGNVACMCPPGAVPPACLWFLNWYHFIQLDFNHSESPHRRLRRSQCSEGRSSVPFCTSRCPFGIYPPSPFLLPCNFQFSHLQVWSGVKGDVAPKWPCCHPGQASCSWWVYTQQRYPACSSKCTGTCMKAEDRGLDNRKLNAVTKGAGKAWGDVVLSMPLAHKSYADCDFGRLSYQTYERAGFWQIQRKVFPIYCSTASLSIEEKNQGCQLKPNYSPW